MKKTLFAFGLIIAATFSLTNCEKEFDAQDEQNNPQEIVKEGIPFELIAKTVETKTTNDELNTNWDDGDEINVFHAPAGTAGYVDEGSFSIAAADFATGSFKGTLASAPESGSHDWYLFYPYSSYLITPANTSAAYYTIGHSFDGSLTQAGNTSMAHLAGEDFPLYGKVTSVAFDETPSVSMNHVCAYVEVIVTNNSDMPLIVEDVSFTATEDIVGDFYVDFHDPSTSIGYVARENKTSKTATLMVDGGSSIIATETAKFYLGFKPFTAPKDGFITVAVNGYEKTIKITADAGISFKAGKIKKINFDYDFKPAYYELADAIAENDEIIIASGSSGDVKVMKHFAGGNAGNYKTIGASVSASKILSVPRMAILTVGKSNGYYTFKDPVRNTYLNATSTTGSNYLKESEDVDNYAEFSVSFNKTTPTVTCAGKTSRHIMKYNSGSDLFACYSSGQNNVFIYKKAKVVTSLDITTPPTKTNYKVGDELDLDGAEIIATYDDSTTEDVTDIVTTDAETVLAHAGQNKTITVSYGGQSDTFNVNVSKGDAGLSYGSPAPSYTVAPNATFTEPSLTNPHGLTIEYTSGNTSLITINATTGKVSIGSSTGGPVTITAHTNGNDDYNEGDATYSITIEDITTYTKVTGTLASGWYVIGVVDNDVVYAINNTVGTSWIKYTSVDVDNNVISDPDDDVVWYYDASAGTLKNADDENYLYWTSGNVGCCGTTSMAHSIQESGTKGIYTVKVSETPSRILRRNGTSGYRYYTTSTGSQSISFFKKD